MSSLIYLIPLALLLGGAALAAFMWSLRSGQYDDLDGAAERIFLEVDGDSVDGGTPDVPSPSKQLSDPTLHFKNAPATRAHGSSSNEKVEVTPTQ